MPWATNKKKKKCNCGEKDSDQPEMVQIIVQLKTEWDIENSTAWKLCSFSDVGRNMDVWIF